MKFPLLSSLSLGLLVVVSQSACSGEDSGTDGSGGTVGSGGSSTGGTSTGGAPTGGSASGGSGGSATGGMATTGGTSSGGATGGAGTGGSASGGASGGADGTGGSAGGTGGGGTGGAAPEGFVFSSPAWGDAAENEDCTPEMASTCPLYPEENTNFGDNVSPAMSWTAGPEGTMSYAIVLVDLSNGFTHWALWDIPSTVTELPASLPAGGTLTDPAGAKQASFGQPAYFGSGACGNVYEHRLYALDVATLPANLTSADNVRNALEAETNVLESTFVRMQSRDYCQ